MALSEAFSGTYTFANAGDSIYLSTGTASLSDVLQGSVVQLFLDLTNFTTGDTLDIWMVGKISSGDASINLNKWTFYGAQGPKGWVSPALLVGNTLLDFQARQFSGTMRSLSWSVRRAT